MNEENQLRLAWMVFGLFLGVLGMYIVDKINPDVIDGEIRILVERETGSSNERPVVISTNWKSNMCPPLFNLYGDAKGWRFKNMRFQKLETQEFFSLKDEPDFFVLPSEAGKEDDAVQMKIKRVNEN